MKKNTLAIVAATPAIPPKPKIAAMIAITKNVMVQRNIILDFMVKNNNNNSTIVPIIQVKGENVSTYIK